MFITKNLNNLCSIIESQHKQFKILNENFNENLFCNIINYKFKYLDSFEKKNNIIYYKFLLIIKNNNLENLQDQYEFKLSRNEIKKVFSLKEFLNMKIFVSDTFFNFVYDIIYQSKKDLFNNKPGILNKIFKSRLNKKIKDNIDNILLLYKFLKRLFMNLFIIITNEYNNLKLNRHYHVSSLLKKSPTEFISNIIEDLCNKKILDSEHIPENFDINKKFINLDEKIKKINNKL